MMLLSINFLERVTGIEPAYRAWEASVLPLNYTRLMIEFYSIYCRLLKIEDKRMLSPFLLIPFQHSMLSIIFARMSKSCLI